MAGETLNSLTVCLHGARCCYYLRCFHYYFSLSEKSLKWYCLPAKWTHFLSNLAKTVPFLWLRRAKGSGLWTGTPWTVRWHPAPSWRGRGLRPVPAAPSTHIILAAFPSSSLRRPVHGVRRRGAVPQLPPELHGRPDVPLLHNGAQGIRWERLYF